MKVINNPAHLNMVSAAGMEHFSAFRLKVCLFADIFEYGFNGGLVGLAIGAGFEILRGYNEFTPFSYTMIGIGTMLGAYYGYDTSQFKGKEPGMYWVNYY